MAVEEYKKARPSKYVPKARKIFEEFIAVKSSKEVRNGSNTKKKKDSEPGSESDQSWLLLSLSVLAENSTVLEHNAQKSHILRAKLVTVGWQMNRHTDDVEMRKKLEVLMSLNVATFDVSLCYYVNQ